MFLLYSLYTATPTTTITTITTTPPTTTTTTTGNTMYVGSDIDEITARLRVDPDEHMKSSIYTPPSVAFQCVKAVASVKSLAKKKLSFV